MAGNEPRQSYASHVAINMGEIKLRDTCTILKIVLHSPRWFVMGRPLVVGDNVIAF